MGKEIKDKSERVQIKQGGRFYYGYVIIAIGFLLMLLSYVALASSTSVFVGPVTESLGINRSTFLVYKSIHSVAAVLAAPFLGRMAAKGMVKKIILISLFSSIIGFGLFSIAQSIWFFYIGGIFTGVGFIGTCTMPISVLVTTWFGGKIRGTMMGFAFMGSGLGGMAMLPFLTYLISLFNWRVAYMGAAVVFLVILIPVVAIFVVKAPEEKGFFRMGQTTEEADAKEITGMTTKMAKKTPMYWLALASVICTTVASGAILSNSIVYYTDMGIDAVFAATLAGLQLGLLIVGKITIGALCDKVGVKFGTTFSMYLFACTFVFLYLMQFNSSFVYAVVLCYGIGGGTITLSPSLMVNQIFGEKEYGKLVSHTTMAVSIGGIFAGPVSAFVFDVTGSYGGFWIFATIFVVLGATCRWMAFNISEKKYKNFGNDVG